MFFVYKFTNKINGKIYIGETCNINIRKEKHFSTAKYGANFSKKSTYLLIDKAINKYGKENFEFCIQEECLTEDKVYEREIYWIKYYDSTNMKKGYNLTEGGRGGKSNPEVNKKISEILKGRINSLSGLLKVLYKLFCLDDDYKKKYFKKKIYKSEKTIEKEKCMLNKIELKNKYISSILPIIGSSSQNEEKIFEMYKTKLFKILEIANLFCTFPKFIYNVCRKYKTIPASENQKFINRSRGQKGKKFSEEARKRMGDAQRGRKFSQEHKDKISLASKGKILSESAKLKISQANSGKNNGMYGKHYSLESTIKAQKSKGKNISGFTVKPINYKTSKTDPKIKEKILEMYLSGDFTKKEIAKQLNIKFNSVNQTIRDQIEYY